MRRLTVEIGILRRAAPPREPRGRLRETSGLNHLRKHRERVQIGHRRLPAIGATFIPFSGNLIPTLPAKTQISLWLPLVHKRTEVPMLTGRWFRAEIFRVQPETSSSPDSAAGSEERAIRAAMASYNDALNNGSTDT